MKITLMKVSIFLINYNNAKFLKRSINSLIKQTYKNIEIIVYDDKSKDDSKKIINSFKGIKKIYSRFKSNKSYMGQINGINECLKISTGEIICLLDSDDFFKKNKVYELIKCFNKEKKNLIIDKPIFFKKNYLNSSVYKKWSFKQRLLTWPHFPPQSCITIKKTFLKKFIKVISYEKFDHLWFDFRILILNFLLNNKVDYIDKYLTFYQLSNDSVSSNYSKFSRLWWVRRLQAHEYIKYLEKKKVIKKRKFFLDYIITKFITIFF